MAMYFYFTIFSNDRKTTQNISSLNIIPDALSHSWITVYNSLSFIHEIMNENDEIMN